MSDQLFLALDNCLRMMDQGADLESCLARYPELATELRPLLLAALDAESITEKDVPVDVMRRSRARVLNAAAELREQKPTKKTLFLFPFRRVFKVSFAAMIVIILMAGIGGTGLVSASNRSLPGDQLYHVKLTWENIRLKLAADQMKRDSLESQFELERVEEINDLINVGRSEQVKFYGQVEGIFPDQFIISGVTVAVTPDTRLDGDIQMNVWVRVEGATQTDGVVVADRIKVINAGSGDSDLITGDSGGSSNGVDDNKGSGKSDGGESGKDNTPEDGKLKTSETQKPESNKTPEPENSDSGNDQTTPQPQSFEIEGIVASYNGSLIVVGNKTIYITPGTELRDVPSEGSKVKIRGYINEDGTLVALRIEVKSSPGSGGGDGGGGDGGGGDGGGGGGSSGGSGDDGPTRTPKPTETDDD
jgi:uncharacterized membrane protein YgcG